nr:gasdermin-E isoform X2 [Zootoca vivipara]
MFAKATKNFVREIDCGGDLIPVSRLNNLDKLQFLNLVTKKKKTWCWQKPKYHLLSVTLNDVLAKDEPIKPVVVESDFVKYEGKFEDYVKGNIETSFGTINLGAGGRGVVESQLSFGNLKKQEADLQKLMKDVEGKAINLHNTLLQQMLERKHEVLCILTERIVTTQKCLISEHIQTEEKMASMVGIKTKVIKVSVSENGNVIKDSNVILEIPAPTAIAYAVIELYIKRDGQFDALQLKTHFQPFMKLSEEKQGTLYQLLCDFLLQEEMVTELEDVLDQICTEDKPELLVMVESKPPVQKNIEDFLQLVGIRLRSKQFLQKDPLSNKELLLAAHILLSAIAELSDYALVLLRACCELQVVPALCCLPNVTSADGTLTLADPALAPLADTQRFQIAQRLFALSNINLEMTESCIKAVTMKKPRFSPIILYIALYGLRALGCKTAQA